MVLHAYAFVVARRLGGPGGSRSGRCRHFARRSSWFEIAIAIAKAKGSDLQGNDFTGRG
jgi:hypothetical protein